MLLCCAFCVSLYFVSCLAHAIVLFVSHCVCCGRWSGKKLTCKEQRLPKIKKKNTKDGKAEYEYKDSGHDKCTAASCPFVAAGDDCPYSPLNPSDLAGWTPDV